MIEPMMKYSFLVYHKEYIEFLKGVRELGVLHIIEKEEGEIQDEEIRERYRQIHELSAAIKFLSKRTISSQPDKKEKDGLRILDELKKLQLDQESYQHKLTQLKKEKTLLEPWGEFKWNTITKLRDSGYKVEFFICAGRNFRPEWEDLYTISRINELSGYIYFVVVDKTDRSIEIDAEHIRLPEISLSKLNTSIREVEDILEKTEHLYNDFAARYVQLLEKTRAKLSSELNFNRVILNTHKEAEDRLMFLEGWIPKDKEADLKTYLNEQGIYYIVSRPEAGDNVPIKLRNNRFSRLFEPIGELYTMPDYKELDLTPFFAPFFMMFFGFCLGDVGYGLLILLAAIILRFKVKPQLKPIITLGIFLGSATVIMGFISGTFFGINLVKAEVSWLEKAKKIMLDYNQLMLLSFGVGFVQTIFGMGIKAANKAIQFGFVHALSTIGWIVFILCGAVLSGLWHFDVITPGQLKTALIIIGAITGFFIFFVNSPGKNPLLNLGVGIWDTYNMASGLLGDLLSYVRLFALGISSAVLGNVFNQLAFSLSPEIPVIGQLITLIILLFGHSLNLFMSALGSFVHPLRLTFVEFYKNAGFAGGGKKYDPFRNTLNTQLSE